MTIQNKSGWEKLDELLVSIGIPDVNVYELKTHVIRTVQGTLYFTNDQHPRLQALISEFIHRQVK